MNNIEKLDYLLKYFYEKDTYFHIKSRELYLDVKNDFTEKELTLAIDKLIIDKYLSQEIESEYIGKIDPPFYCRITYHGALFFERGGYKSERIRMIKAKFISTAKIVMIATNAIIILAIAAASVYFSYDSKEKDETIKEKDKKIEMLSAKVDSVTTLQKIK